MNRVNKMAAVKLLAVGMLALGASLIPQDARAVQKCGRNTYYVAVPDSELGRTLENWLQARKQLDNGRSDVKKALLAAANAAVSATASEFTHGNMANAGLESIHFYFTGLKADILRKEEEMGVAQMKEGIIAKEAQVSALKAQMNALEPGLMDRIKAFEDLSGRWIWRLDDLKHFLKEETDYHMEKRTLSVHC